MNSKSIGTFAATFALVVAVTSPVTFYSDDAEARRGGGGGFRSSGRSSSSFKSYGSRSTASASKPKLSKPKAAKPVPKKVKVTSSNRGMTRTQLASKQQASKASYTASKAKYQSKPTATPKATTASQKNFVSRSSRTNDYGTYYSRRSNYYRGYSAPRYVYAGSPSYGIWDTMFLYHMMSNPVHAGAFGYNHYGDPGYSAWRRQANIQAQENAELKAQLAAMDAKINGMSGTRNTDYIPPGTDSDLALATALVESNKPVLRICTGQADGTYAKIGNLYKTSVTSAEVNVVATNGSVQNLEYMASGKCDASFTQSDAYWTYYEKNKGKVEFNITRMPLGFRETAHLVCNARTDADTIDELTAQHTVYLGQEGSGASVTWSNLITENADLSRVNTAYGSRQEIRQNVGVDQNACLLYVGALDSDRVVALNNMAERVKMIDIADSDYLKIVNPAQNRVYKSQEIEGNHYANLHDSDYGWSWDIDTITVGAEVAVSDRWIHEVGDTLYYKVLGQISATKFDIRSLNNVR